MERSDKLLVAIQRKQCNEMIQALNNQNTALYMCRGRLADDLASDELKGDAYRELEVHMNCYQFLVNALVVANEYQIEACELVKNSIGKENLIGEQILANIERCKEQMQEAADQIEVYRKELINNPGRFEERFYSLLIQYEENKYESAEDEYKKMREKERKFDDIVSNTAAAFDGIKEIRAQVCKAMETLKNNFAAGSYGKLAYGWNWEVYRAVDNCSKKTILLNDKFIAVTDEQKNIFYGGSQKWFDNGTIFGKQIVNNGGGFISFVNYQCFLEGKIRLSKDEFVAEAEWIRKHGGEFPHRYALESGITAPCYHDNRIGCSMKDYVSECAKKCGQKSGGWETTKEISLDKIKDQIYNNIPVLLCIGEKASNDTALPFYYKGAACEFYVDADRQDVTNEMVVITGVETVKSISTQETRTMLHISTQGEEMYIDYNELANCKQTLLEGMSKKEAKEYCETGFYNISYVEPDYRFNRRD